MAKNFFEEYKDFIGDFIYGIIGSPFDNSFLREKIST